MRARYSEDNFEDETNDSMIQWWYEEDDETIDFEMYDDDMRRIDSRASRQINSFWGFI